VQCGLCCTRGASHISPLADSSLTRSPEEGLSNTMISSPSGIAPSQLQLVHATPISPPSIEAPPAVGAGTGAVVVVTGATGSGVGATGSGDDEVEVVHVRFLLFRLRSTERGEVREQGTSVWGLRGRVESVIENRLEQAV